MTLGRHIRNFILGSIRDLPSHLHYKRVLLTGQLTLVAMVVCLIYIILGLTIGLTTTWSTLCTCLVLTTVCFILNRTGYYTTAKIILAISINSSLFVLCLLEPFEAGLYTFFIICGLAALTIFGAEERGKAIFFVCLSAALFLVSMIVTFDMEPNAVYTHEYIRINIIVNFTASLIATILIVYFLISVNHHTETALRSNEQQIQNKNLELVKLNTELDRFVYSTSHDLRAPISSIQGLIQLIRMTEDPAEIRKYIDIMNGRLANLTKFIGDISDYARNARVDLHVKPIHVEKMVSEILDTLKFYPGAERIKINTDIDRDFTIESDPIRLQIILGNLISNAFKYADHRKETPWLAITAARDNEAVCFTVADNGVGIKEEFLPRIFDMFFQGTDKSEGSGLGLYIVRESVEKIGGTIEVESVIGSGAKFTVVL